MKYKAVVLRLHHTSFFHIRTFTRMGIRSEHWLNEPYGLYPLCFLFTLRNSDLTNFNPYMHFTLTYLWQTNFILRTVPIQFFSIQSFVRTRLMQGFHSIIIVVTKLLQTLASIGVNPYPVYTSWIIFHLKNVALYPPLFQKFLRSPPLLCVCDYSKHETVVSRSY